MKLNLKNVFLSVGMLVFSFALFGLVSVGKAEAAATTCTAELSGDWNNITTWDTACNTDGFPDADDTVIIPSGKVVNVNVGSAALSVTINNAGAATGLTFAGGVTLAVTGNVTLSAPTPSAGTTTVAIGAGTLTAGSLNIVGGDSGKISEVTVGAGTLTVNAGALTLSGFVTNAKLTSTGHSTISVSAGNLINGGTIAFTGTAGTTLSVQGTTTISDGATLTLSDTTGTYTFTGLFTVLSGGEYEETVTPTHVTFSGAKNNAGTFTTFGTGFHTWGGTVTNSGTGTFNLTDATIPTFVAATTEGTVNYTGAGQTIQVIGYHNLGLSGTDTKVLGALSGVNAIAGTLTITGPTQASLTSGDSSANKLYFAASLQRSGTWGSSGSDPIATHVSDTYFLPGGTKKVTVATGGSSSINQPTQTTVTTCASNLTLVNGVCTATTTSTDTTAPSGTSVSINAGVSTTSSLSSTLTFTAIDATEMMISNDAGFAGASWESYAGSKAWTLTTGDGVKTVYARFRDALGNMSTAVIDAITVSVSGTVAVPSNEPTQGCSNGNAYNSSTGAVCVNNATAEIPGCGNRNTGFSSASGVSCAQNKVVSTTTTTYNFGTVTLKNGSKGEAVKELQRFLNAKLFLGLVVDGSLGPKTIIVIKKWQKDNGLVSDGLVGAKTKAMMNK